MKAFNKKLIAGAMATSLMFAAGGAFAGSYGQQRDPAERLSYIFTQLEITEAQQAQIVEIMETVVEEQREAMWDTMKELRDSEDRPTAEEMQAMRDTHRAEHLQLLTDQLNTVLSPEVTEDLVEYLEAHGMGKAYGRGGNGQRGGHNGGGHQGGNQNKGGRF